MESDITEVMCTRYTCGFAVCGTRVLLILKNRGPASVVGCWNGVGGKLKEGELLQEGMSREFEEEAELKLPQDRWTHRIALKGQDGLWQVDFLIAFITDEEERKIHKTESEVLGWFELDSISPEKSIFPLKAPGSSEQGRMLKAPLAYHVAWALFFSCNKSMAGPIEVYQE